MPRATSRTDAILQELRAFGLAYPGAHTKSPWPGHLDLAVKDKTFAYLSVEGEPIGISCKLPQSSAVALMLPFTKPTEYGLGKSGWVSARFAAGEIPDVELLKAWIDESYRAQAPKKLVASLPAPGGVAGAAPAPSKTTAAKKAPSAKVAVAKKTPAGNKPAARKAAAKAAPARKKAAVKKPPSAPRLEAASKR